jgi:Rhamnan synthesis protein F
LLPKILPYWKLKREVLRIRTQLGFPIELLSMPIRRKMYDINKHKSIVHSPGKHPIGKNVAVVLIFQRNGVCDSVLETLRHLNENGFSPIVVSNVKLSGPDLEILCENASHVLERPNLGYDFGGYRDGVLHLLNNNILPENLILLNDSIWFPVRKGCDFLTQVKEQDADLFGIVYAENPDAPEKNHLQSYFFNFKKVLIGDPEFRSFWENMFFSQNRNWVIKKCEMGLTQHFKNKGFSIGWLCDHGDLEEALISLSKPDLKMVASYQINIDEKSSKILKEFVDSELSESTWKKDTRILIRSGVFGKYMLIAHPEILIKNIKFPVLKKDKQNYYRVQRKELLRCGVDKFLTPIVKKEIIEKQKMLEK